MVKDVTDARGGQPANELLALSGELFGTSLDVERTLSQLAELVVPRMADWAAVDVLDESDNFRRVGVAHVDPAGTDLLRELHDRYPLRANEGRLRGRVVATREPIALYDVDERELLRLSRDKEHYQMLTRLGIRSAMWVPLVVRDRVVGVLSAGYRDTSHRYSPADLNLMRELARRAALAVDNALLYRGIKRAETRQAAIASLGQVALAGARYAELAQSAAETLAEIMGVTFAEVLQLQPGKKQLLLVAGVGWKEGLVGSATVKAGLGSQGGYTLTTVGPVVLDDLATETRFRPPPLLVSHAVVSGVTVLIGSPQAPYGVLGAHSAQHRVFAEDDVNFLQTVANVLGAARERQEGEDRLNRLAIAENARAAQLRAVIQSIGDAVVVCDMLGIVLLANPAAETLLGQRVADGLAGILNSFEWPAGAERADLEAGVSIELRLARPAASTNDGETEQWLELSAFPVLGSEPEVAASGGTILVMRDVTAARNARNVRDAFLGILSHELRTPVTTIYGGSEMLARRAASITEEERRGVYEDIRAEADRLYRLVENLLVLSHVERQGLEIDPEPVLLQRLIPRVIESESTRWLDATFVTELPAGLPPVAAEETYLEQILRNLVGNAAKYGGSGPIVVGASDLGSAVRVTITDSGPGFPDVEKDRLFELFYRSPELARTASGAGIGLFVCRQLITAMNGRMWASNRPGKGAEFGFELPVFETTD